ncbi:RIP metalloprotease RseP [Candidatus Parcubacteria bacterium]|nr:RIP metalloprotease RseP [Candidatus Parcubacteria bacterium]
MTVLLMVLAFVLFVGLVVVHEWGHFLAARRGGVEVEEFGIGFPPKVWGRKVKTNNSKFLFTINLLPLGGFVKLKGENDEDRRPATFGAAPIKTKIKIMLAGVFMNLVVAILLFSALAVLGMPKLVDKQYTIAGDTKVIQEIEVLTSKVTENSPAEQAGIKEGDRIVSINNTQISRLGEIGDLTEENAGQTVPIVIERNGKRQALEVALNQENDGGFLGVATEPGASAVQLQRSTWSAPIVGVGLSAQLTGLTFEGLGKVFSSLFKGDTKTASEQVTGPVGIVKILEAGSQIGLSFVLVIIAIISLTLAIINALPIPALDGGRLFVLLLFRALNKPLKKETEELIHGAGFVALMGLIILITIVDIKRFF